jgi:hypothetical protein
MKHARNALLISLSSTCLPVTAPAATFDTRSMTADDGFVVPLLEATSQRYVDAMRRIIATRFPGDYDALAWERLEEHMREERVARFEYRYMKNGVPGKRIYYAIDGEPLGTVAQRILEAPARVINLASDSDSDSGSDSDSDSDAGWGDYDVKPEPLDEPALAEMEERDSAVYTGFGEDEVRAPFRPARGSVLSAGHLQGRNRAFDAEFKALGAIENDIATGVVPATGGEVVGMVSGSVCASCRYAGKTFAALKDTPVTVTQMFNAIHPAERKALIAAGQARARGAMLINTSTGRPWFAADALAGARDGQVRKALNPVAVDGTRSGTERSGRRFRLGPVASEAAEAGAPPGC